jgi:hypothetical protein
VPTTTATTEPTILATRTTADGVTVFLHEDGQVSNRVHYYRTRLPMAVAFRVMDDLCLADSAEIPALLRAAKKGGRS